MIRNVRNVACLYILGQAAFLLNHTIKGFVCGFLQLLTFHKKEDIL